MASLMEDAKAKVIAFWIECNQVENNQTYTSQLHLLKMIHLTTVNNKTASETLRNNLLSYAANVKNQQNSNFLWCQLFKTQGKRERVSQQYAYLLMAYVQSRDCTSSSMLMTGIPITLMANYQPTLTMSNPGGDWRPSSTTLYIKEHAGLSLLNKSRLFSSQCSSSRYHKNAPPL